MNYEEIFKIIEQLKKINSIRANKLAKLVQKHMDETDPVKQKNLGIKIYSYVYWVFIELLDTNSRHNIYNLGLDILEDCDSIEKEANNGWLINYSGAFRYTFKNGEATLVNRIPRSYKKGFHLTEESGVEGMDFINMYGGLLNIISSRMDRREEYITYNKKPKNKKISNEFIEELIDYLHLPKVNSEESIKETKKEI